jgi:hypothetical protein
MATRSVNANADRIRQIKTFPSLVKYLRDELNWPIEADDFEDLTYDWEPEELGIDPVSAAKIDEVKQLRPLADDQPWGIFFVKFEPKQLPVVALRRLLNSMVIRKRASANKSERQVWAMNDLMFISSFGESGEGRHISFAHFSQPEGKNDLPTLKVLGWDNLDTHLHLNLVAAKLVECLSWPEDERDIEGWRDTWQSAFSLRHREAITTAKDLAIRLAALARAIRDRISTALAIENDRGSLTKLMRAFQSALLHDLDAAGFADMYAQTIAYGLLSARIADPSSRTADDLTAHMKTSPFLKELMQTFLHVGRRKGKAGGLGIDFDELGLSEVVELLDDANMEAVLRDFGDKKRDEDPVMHFYESFLHEYNKQLKIQRGVFYTPQPVVSYIVRSVHELLQTEFGLADGLADTTTWGEMLKKHPGMKLPPLTDEPGEKRTISPDEPFIQILDPATGTATFLVEVVDVIYRTLVAKWKQQRLTEAQQCEKWNEYVPKHLLPRLHAFELMMAPYAIAHMKFGLKLVETGYRFETEERACIYLTNALEPSQKQLRLPELDVLAHEAIAVNNVKRGKRFTVVIGNPPYSNYGQLNRIPFILNLLASYKQGLDERKINLDDDYIKFIRFAQYLVSGSGRGIVGMITNNSYIDGVTHRQMRKELHSMMTSINILDLHGSATRKERAPDGSKDENVFDIQQGVAVMLMSCEPTSKVKPVAVKYAELWGLQAQKYVLLGQHDWQAGTFHPVSPISPYFMFKSGLESAHDDYDSWMSLPEIFPAYTSGIQTKRDALTMRRSMREIESVRKDFLHLSDEALRLKYGIAPDGRDWTIPLAKADVRESQPPVQSVLYRLFDTRYTLYSGKSKGFIAYPRAAVISALFNPSNFGLVYKRQATSDVSGYTYFFVVDQPISEGVFAIDPRGREFVAPLYTPNSTDLLEACTDSNVNINKTFVEQVASHTNLSYRESSKRKSNDTFDEIAVFDYVYGTCWLPIYRTENLERLRSDYPRVPVPVNRKVFETLSNFGKRLREIHLLKKHSSGISYFGDRAVEVGKATWRDQKLYISSDSYFAPVSEDVWLAVIGGYHVCHKWLKDKKGTALAELEISHFIKVLGCLDMHVKLLHEFNNVNYR